MTVLRRGHSAVAVPRFPGVIYMSKESREGEGTEKGSIPICGRNLYVQETTENAFLGGQRVACDSVNLEEIIHTGNQFITF